MSPRKFTFACPISTESILLKCIFLFCFVHFLSLNLIGETGTVIICSVEGEVSSLSIEEEFRVTLDVSSGTFTDGVTGVVDGLEVISGSAQITAFGFVSSSVGDTLQQVTVAGATTDQAVVFENTTDSTSKTTGAVTIGGGLGVNNTINAGGDVIAYATSDKRLKDNIQPIEGALDKVSQISGNTFDWNEEKQNIYKGKDYGVIAQEIQKVMPELVDTRDNGYLAVKYEKIVPLLIESIKELKKEIEELKSK